MSHRSAVQTHELTVAHARDLVRALDLARALDLDLARAVGQCRETADRLARTLEGNLETTPETASPSTREPASRSPGRTVRLLTSVGCCLLPATYRSRYDKEFYAELFDLPRRYRLAHAVRILRTAPAIRASLRAAPSPDGRSRRAPL
jgi:hypothetical protein